MTRKSKTPKTQKTDIKIEEKKPPSNSIFNESIFSENSGVFAPFHSLRKEVDDLFNQFSHRLGTDGKAEVSEFRVPLTDIDETDDAYEISTELPGIAQKDIDITVENSTLTIHGEREQTKKSGNAKNRVTESSYGVYERSLSLPFAVDAKTVEAEYDNGVLHLTIPKPAQVEAVPQKIAIKSAA
jgi:HSP20 family protein